MRGEEEKNAGRLVTTLGCKTEVVGETSMNGLGHKSVSEFLPSTVLNFWFLFFISLFGNSPPQSQRKRRIRGPPEGEKKPSRAPPKGGKT